MPLKAKCAFDYETGGEIVKVAQGEVFTPPKDREAVIIKRGLAEPVTAKDKESAS